MKFVGGDETDRKHCIALKHEALRCQEAFQEFARLGTQLIMIGKDRRLAFRMYNAYARFVLHLYEFMVGAMVRDHHDTQIASGPGGYLKAERYLAGHAQRLLTNRREAIINGTAPSWENALSAYPETVPASFAADFRHCRNKALGHVDHERAQLSLSEFYVKYHLFLYLLYYDVMSWWGRQGDELPDLQEITDFTIALKAQPPAKL